MQQVIRFFKIYQFPIAVFFILLLAGFLRFYDIDNRWGIGNDSARDIAIARQSLVRGEIPVSGPFSSAGPFVFGPVFYWILISSYLFFPFVFIAPVLMTAFMGFVTVALLMASGYLLGGKKLALIVGLITAISPQLVIRSVTVGQQSFIPAALALLFFMFILFWQRKKLIFPFVMGIALACALSLHYQVINMLIFFPALLFVPKISFPKKLMAIAVMFVGFLIPTMPFLIWDAKQNFANVNNVLDYLLVAQYRLYVPNSWKLFIFDYLPTYWSMVTSGYNVLVAKVIMFFTFGSLAFYFLKDRKQLTSILFIFAAIFGILLIVNRYYRGERSEGYLVYLAPFILLFTSWAIYQLFSVTRSKLLQRIAAILGVLLLTLIMSVNFISARSYIQGDNTLKDLKTVIAALERTFPNQQFAIYDYESRYTYQSQPLSLFLGIRNKIDHNDGVPLGVVCGGPDCSCVDKKCTIRMKEVTKYQNQIIVDLRIIKELQNKKDLWVRVSEEDMYDNLIGWAKKHELQSTFSLQNYLLEKLHLR